MPTLYQKIIQPENLLSAFHRASEGKRFRPSVMLFEKDLSVNIFRLHFLLKNKTWRHGKYRFFTICDQKERKISAAPFADRIVHHALCKIIEPVFEKSFIDGSYANRKNKGTHKAVKKLQTYLGRFTRERERERFYGR